jgi:hypothetical protein
VVLGEQVQVQAFLEVPLIMLVAVAGVAIMEHLAA